MIGTTLKGRFLLEKELGRGGMGAVYKANDQILQRSVAIKVLKELAGEEVGRRLCLEAQILARLLHENIVRLYDFDTDADGTYYFIMEEVDGSTYHRRGSQVTLAERLQILAQVADALDYAHHQGVIHRDIKPGNILLTATDQAKLSDFGLSLFAHADQETGVARGTPAYMSPEQARGHRLDHRTDLYSLGVLAYEAATGMPPFQGKPMEVMAQHVNDTPIPPKKRNPRISRDLDEFILQLLSKAPESRPGSGQAVASTLREILSGTRWADASVADEPQVSASSPTVATEPVPGPVPGPVPENVSRAERAASTVKPSRPSNRDRSGSPLARRMLRDVEAEPIILSAEERYLAGHYLAYLLGGSRRRGLLMRRPLDPLNADRSRLILAMTWLMLQPEGSASAVPEAAALLDDRTEIRSMLSPVVVIKYLQGRDTPAKRKRFRQVRQQLQQASEHARKQLTDDRGTLNPGMIPQALDDLRKLAPERNEIDDQLVARWNRIADLWRGHPDFREAVLQYATRNAAQDPASIDLWPEVVYPLIERARWQRRYRSRVEALWDVVSGQVLFRPDAGVRMDRVLQSAVPAQVVEELDDSVLAFEANAELADALGEAGDVTADRPAVPSLKISTSKLQELADDQAADRGFVRLADPDPVRFTHGELRELWKEAIAALRSPTGSKGHQHVPVGPYRLAVIASIRGHKAGTIAIQGMANKQVEMLVPSFQGGGSAARPILAVWVYRNRSLAITYLDTRGAQRFILWDAATNQQTNFDDPADLNHNLLKLSMEAPDQLSRVLSRRFRPSKAV
ncbi:hypothetical protein BH23PLA1_BH23PLA1_04540 [soil metagenome]